MPRGIRDFTDRTLLGSAETGVFLDHTHGIPHFRMSVPSHRHANAPDYDLVYDVTRDPEQQKPVRDPRLEGELAARMRALLEEYDAPECQAVRTGLK